MDAKQKSMGSAIVRLPTLFFGIFYTILQEMSVSHHLMSTHTLQFYISNKTGTERQKLQIDALKE